MTKERKKDKQKNKKKYYKRKKFGVEEIEKNRKSRWRYKQTISAEKLQTIQWKNHFFQRTKKPQMDNKLKKDQTIRQSASRQFGNNR